LASLVSVYRGVLLYGDSGSGKSSLVNAGLIPEAIRLGFAPERLRVQPRTADELVIERIRSADDNEEELLPSVLVLAGQSSARTTLTMYALEKRVRAACEQHRPLLIFDQFEEIVTLFDEAGARDTQRRLIELLVRLLRGSLPVKVLFSFREDYLGKIKELLAACPELVDQALRIASPPADALPTIIREPFERYPGHFARQLSPALADRLVTVLAGRFGTGDISLSEVQTVCLRLWQSNNPEALLTEKGPQGLLEDYLGEALDGMPAQLRPTATALLAHMVTSAGTRNVISASDLLQRVQEQERDITPNLFDQALEGLSQSRLVRRERRRDLDLYEITSEFLVPWISRRRDEFRRLQDRRHEHRRLLILGSIAAALLLVAALVAAFAVKAQHDARTAMALALASDAQANAERGPDIALLLSLAALAPYGAGPSAPAVARGEMIEALETTRLEGVVGILHADAGSVDSVAFSPDGRTLASGSQDGTVRLWDVATHKELGSPFMANNVSFSSVTFSPDGRTVAAASDNGTVFLWDVATHKQLGSALIASSVSFRIVAFSPDGRTVAAAAADGTVFLWDVASHTQLGSLLTGSVDSLAFSPDGRTLATAVADGTVFLWDVASHTQLGSPLTSSTTGPVGSLAFSHDGRTLAAGFGNGRLQLWDAATHKRLGSPLTGDASAVDSLVFSPDGRTLVSGSQDGTVYLWDPATHKQLGSPLTGDTSAVGSVAFSPDGRTLASGSGDGTVQLWDLATSVQPGSPLTVNTNSASFVGDRAVAFSPDGRTLASSSGDGTVQLWDLANHTQLGSPLTSDTGSVDSVAFSPDGRTLASGGSDGTVQLWDLANHTQLGSPLTSDTGPVDSVAFSPDGRTLASGRGDGTVQLWDLANHTQLGSPLTSDTGPVESLTFSPDGSTLAVGGDNGTVQLWDLANHTQLGSPLIDNHGPVDSVAFSPDGRTLASGSGGIQLWDVATQTRLGMSLPGNAGPIQSVAFSPDGNTLVSASYDGTVRSWSGFLWHDFTELRNEVCGLVGTGLIRSEWTHYAPGIAYQNSCS
jgi:WD40 repeat protein